MDNELFLYYKNKASKYFTVYKKLLEEFIKFPSVANRDYHVMINCAEWLRIQFEYFGYKIILSI